MRSENTPPNFSAKERIIYEIVITLQFFNYIHIVYFDTASCFFNYLRPSQATGRRTLFQYFSINNTIACSPVAG